MRNSISFLLGDPMLDDPMPSPVSILGVSRVAGPFAALYDEDLSSDAVLAIKQLVRLGPAFQPSALQGSPFFCGDTDSETRSVFCEYFCVRRSLLAHEE